MSSCVGTHHALPSCVLHHVFYTLYAPFFYVHPRYILVLRFIIHVCIYVHLYILLTHSLSNTPLTAPLHIRYVVSVSDSSGEIRCATEIRLEIVEDGTAAREEALARMEVR